MIETPLAVTTSSSATEPATLPPWPAAMSTITLPDFMRGDHLLGDQPGRRPAGDQRGGDDDVDVGHLLGVHARGAPVEVLAHLPGVAVGADLLPRRRAPPRTHRRATAPARRPPAGRRWPGRSRRGCSPRRSPPARPRRRRPRAPWPAAPCPAAVTWPVKNRPKVCAASITARYPAMLAIERQHVQRLGPGDARHRVHRQRGDRPLRQRLHQLRVQRRGQQADQRRPAAAAARSRRPTGR